MGIFHAGKLTILTQIYIITNWSQDFCSMHMLSSYFLSLFDYRLVLTFYFLKDRNGCVASRGNISPCKYCWRHWNHAADPWASCEQKQEESNFV